MQEHKHDPPKLVEKNWAQDLVGVDPSLMPKNLPYAKNPVH